MPYLVFMYSITIKVKLSKMLFPMLHILTILIKRVAFTCFFFNLIDLNVDFTGVLT